LGLSERLAICRQLAIQIVDVEFVHDASSSIRENQEVLDKKEASALIRKHLIVDVETEIAVKLTITGLFDTTQLFNATTRYSSVNYYSAKQSPWSKSSSIL
jgi:hypothetical protein